MTFKHAPFCRIHLSLTDSCGHGFILGVLNIGSLILPAKSWNSENFSGNQSPFWKFNGLTGITQKFSKYRDKSWKAFILKSVYNLYIQTERSVVSDKYFIDIHLKILKYMIVLYYHLTSIRNCLACCFLFVSHLAVCLYITLSSGP